MRKKVSVIMSVYNDEKYVGEAIESILKQKFEDFEFIICNDCSADKSGDIIQKYAQKDRRIIYFTNEKNMGLASSLNRCLEKSTGEYIARMDSDDYSLKYRLKKQVEFLDMNPWCAVLGGQIEYINSFGEVYRESSFKQEISKRDVIMQVCVAHPTVLMRREVLEKVGGYTVSSLTNRAEDYDLWCKIVEHGFVLHNLSDKVLKYREDRGAIKKRKYKYRIEEFRIKNYWRKRMGYSIAYVVYAIKPLIIGMLPSFIYRKLKKIK